MSHHAASLQQRTHLRVVTGTVTSQQYQYYTVTAQGGPEWPLGSHLSAFSRCEREPTATGAGLEGRPCYCSKECGHPERRKGTKGVPAWGTQILLTASEVGLGWTGPAVRPCLRKGWKGPLHPPKQLAGLQEGRCVSACIYSHAQRKDRNDTRRNPRWFAQAVSANLHLHLLLVLHGMHVPRVLFPD